MIERWWTYQRERFPLAAYATLAAVFSLSALAFSALLRFAEGFPGLLICVAAGASALLVFVQMRVLDEFKDFADDSRFRPYRALPRGVVTLNELGWIGAVAAIAQLAIALAVDARLAWLLLAIWSYLMLMTAEFFAPEWLKAHPFAYLASHVPLNGITALYLTAFEWLPAGEPIPPALLLFSLASVLATALLEIGRKIRSPRDEETGVVTYTAAWGRKGAVVAWLAAFAVTLVLGTAAAHAIDLGVPFAALSFVLCVVAFLSGLRFLRRPATSRAKQLEALSATATLALYLGIGPLAYLLVS